MLSDWKGSLLMEENNQKKTFPSKWDMNDQHDDWWLIFADIQSC